MAYERGNFYTYISAFRVEKGAEFTHTSFTKPMGSFYLPSEEIDNFYKIYEDALDCKEDLYVMEKHRDISPFLIDFDFRFEKSAVKRQYTLEHIKAIVQLYMEKIAEYIDMDQETKVYIMEKPNPVKDSKKDLVKDGIHIIIPDIVTRPSIQLLIRNNVLVGLPSILNNIQLQNPYDDVLDEAVINKNNWIMYGSKKPNLEPYKVTNVFSYMKESNSLMIVENAIKKESELVQLFSIRNKYDSSVLKNDKLKEVTDFEAKILNKKNMALLSNPALQLNPNNKKNVCENMDLVEKLVDVLSDKRSDSFQEWIRVGWCMRNIDHRLLPKWIDFSKRSSKFEEGGCEKIWNFMKDDGLGIGTLHMWAKQDNPEAYRELLKNDLTALIYKSTSETHTDIARVVYYMYKYTFVCVSIKNNMWYEFRNHRWVSCDCGHILRAKISDEVVREYCRQASYYNDKATNEEIEAEQHRYLEIVKKLNTIAIKLKQTAFKDNIMKECREQFYLEKFEERLDSRCNLIGFENGVYDLDVDEFRDGRPEDYISFSTGTEYYPYDETHPNAIDMQEFISKIFTIPQVKNYVLTLLASFLNGNIREEKFHIWTGSGSNGKSKFIELFESSFGEYCVKFPITLLTRKRADSNAATSELARAKGKRFAALQEPSEDEKLNIGLMKELSGGDKIMARLIYREPIEFKPQFKMILACNHLPVIPSDDGGTWRRIRVVEFTSKFCESPDPNKPHEFRMDTKISSKILAWKEIFISLLIEYSKLYKIQGIREPEEVLKCTRDYQRSNDGFLDFVESELEKAEDNVILDVNDAYACFKSWIGDNAPPHFKNIPKKTFSKNIEKILGPSFNQNKIVKWRGWTFKNKNTVVDDLEK